ncbi:uncharacterized protein KY384_002657 [Bacidia gigantensis]|uniref:uncharacterized protein n=1 Tax=Bacidia gigantensis TaxID=2732470 RepID=UPI001D03A162|nr:uncharacterized protein KY384_002657 [Bacidia gigantensis]KAG8532779.1 hypothetical protein KY384_002657 [Bacidia gigantensis]
MRPPSLPTILRSLTLTNLTRPFLTTPPRPFAHLNPSKIPNSLPLRSMPTLPFGLGAFFSSSSETMSNTEPFPVQKSKDEWQAVLNPEQFRVIREKGTEAPGTGEYDKHMPKEGAYTCRACGAPLYRATHKFKSGCGWPAYFDSIPGAVKRNVDRTFGMERTEIVCANCGGHLGHVFKGEGYPTPTNERHCVNSVSLRFAPEEKEAAQ